MRQANAQSTSQPSQVFSASQLQPIIRLQGLHVPYRCVDALVHTPLMDPVGNDPTRSWGSTRGSIFSGSIYSCGIMNFESALSKSKSSRDGGDRFAID